MVADYLSLEIIWNKTLHMSKYLNDPREDVLRTETGVGYYLEEDKREEKENGNWFKWGARVLDLCDLPVEEYMKPMEVNVAGGGGGGGDTGSTTTKYTLRYYVNRELKKTVSNLEEGDLLPEYDVSEEGYDVSEWKDTDGNSYDTMPAKDLKLYCTKTVRSYDVRFIIDNETVTAYTVNYNEYATNVPSTTKTGYTFNGWEPNVNTTKITGNTDFVGSYTVNKYTLTWSINGETTTEEYDYGETIIYPTVSVSGYTFNGWINYQETMPARNITIEAILIPNEPEGATDFYYGSKMNSDLTGTVDSSIVVGLTNMEISDIDIDASINFNAQTFESIGMTQQEIDDWFDNYDEDENPEFVEEWNATHKYSLIVVYPSNKNIVTFKQGAQNAPDWSSDYSHRTDYGTITINGETYNVAGFRADTSGYVINDGSPIKPIYINIE